MLENLLDLFGQNKIEINNSDLAEFAKKNLIEINHFYGKTKNMFILEDKIKELENKMVELEKQLKDYHYQAKKEELAKQLEECEKAEKTLGKTMEMYLLIQLFNDTILSNEPFNDFTISFIKDVLKIENFENHNNPQLEYKVEMMNYFAENIIEIKNLLKLNCSIENLKLDEGAKKKKNGVDYSALELVNPSVRENLNKTPLQELKDESYDMLQDINEINSELEVVNLSKSVLTDKNKLLVKIKIMILH